LQVTLHDLVTVVTITVTVLHCDSHGLQRCNRLSIFKLTLLPQLLPVPRRPILFLCPLLPHLCALTIPSSHLHSLAFTPSWPWPHLRAFVAPAPSSHLRGPLIAFPLCPYLHAYFDMSPFLLPLVALLWDIMVIINPGPALVPVVAPPSHAHCGLVFARPSWPCLHVPIMAPSSCLS
jgi:hypothetical protein